jgi:hypothetical protein
MMRLLPRIVRVRHCDLSWYRRVPSIGYPAFLGGYQAPLQCGPNSLFSCSPWIGQNSHWVKSHSRAELAWNRFLAASQPSERRDSGMNAFRKYMSMVFAISSLLGVWIACRFIPAILHLHHASLSHVLLAVSVFPVLAVIYSVAWWTIWKEKRSARAWGIAASLTYVLINLQMIFYSSRPVPSCVWIMSAIGVVGLVAFSWRDELHERSEDPTEFADQESGDSGL